MKSHIVWSLKTGLWSPANLGSQSSWLLSSVASGKLAIPDLSGLVCKMRTLAFYTTVVRIK